MEKEYEPFGEEWKCEVRKWTKDVLIDQYREATVMQHKTQRGTANV